MKSATLIHCSFQGWDRLPAPESLALTRGEAGVPEDVIFYALTREFGGEGRGDVVATLKWPLDRSVWAADAYWADKVVECTAKAQAYVAARARSGGYGTLPEWYADRAVEALAHYRASIVLLQPGDELPGYEHVLEEPCGCGSMDCRPTEYTVNLVEVMVPGPPPPPRYPCSRCGVWRGRWHRRADHKWLS